MADKIYNSVGSTYDPDNTIYSQDEDDLNAASSYANAAQNSATYAAQSAAEAEQSAADALTILESIPTIDNIPTDGSNNSVSSNGVYDALLGKSDTSHAHSGVYEPTFTKNTAFNKNFGTSADTVAEGNHNHALDGLSNVTISSIVAGELLKWNGTAWINNTLAEAGISATSHTHSGVYEPANSYLMKTNVAQTMTEQLTVKETKETYYTMTGTEINPANGTIQFKELTASVTLTEVLESGQSITLMLKDADLYTLTLPTLTWCTTAGNVAPEWTGLDTIVLWKVSTVLFAAYLGSYE